MASNKDDFIQRRKKQGASAGSGRIWHWTINPRVSIRERLNDSGGLGYRVTFPKKVTGGRTIHLQSKDFEEAKAIARSRGKDFQESRSTALALGDAHKIQAASAVRTLASASVDTELGTIAKDYVSAADLLRPYSLDVTAGARLLASALSVAQNIGRPLMELVEYAAERLKPAGGLKTVAQVAREMVTIKKAWHKRGDLRDASLRDFENRAGKIESDLGEFQLTELTKDRVLQWLAGLELAPRTLKNYRMVLAELLSYAVQKRYLRADQNPLAELTRHDVKELEGAARTGQQPAILSPAQAEALLTAAFDNSDLDLGAAVALGLFCGIRTEELKRLSWYAVRLTEAQPFVVIGPEIAKKRRIRNVTIPAAGVAWLQRWANKKGQVTRSAHENDFQKRFKKLAKAAGIKWESNAMRHSFGSYHFALHGNSVETARLLGHKQDDSVLFAHYRALASKEQGAAYFAIMPKSVGAIVQFPAQRA